MKIYPVIFFGICFIFMSGCSQKTAMRILEPAEVDRIANTKKITVSNFNNDKVGLSRKIEANLAKFRIDNKKYFTIVSRNDFDKLLKEQHVQNSGLVDPKTVVEVGQLIGAEAIISGNVGRPTSYDSSFYENRVRYVDIECDRVVKYRVRCKNRIIGLSSELRIVDVERGEIIFTDTFSDTVTYKSCRDDRHVIPSVEIAAQRLATNIANKFTYKLTPHYRYFEVILFEDPDLDYTDEQKKLLEISLKYLKHSLYDKAEELLLRLVDATASKSYVPLYNLGVISEARGKYVDAKEYYIYADNLMMDPLEEIREAIVRIDRLMLKRERTRKQINR